MLLESGYYMESCRMDCDLRVETRQLLVKAPGLQVVGPIQSFWMFVLLMGSNLLLLLDLDRWSGRR